MWTTEASGTTTASKEKIWKLYQDTATWPTWDHEVQNIKLFGAFETGTKGIIKPKGGPKAKFEMIECTPQKSFTDRSFLPLCKMDFIHTIQQTDKGLLVTHKVIMTGLLTFFFSKVIGSKIKAGLPTTVQNLIKLAENK
jgi:hypothetical protein